MRPGRGRLDGIEGLRALAATAVLAFHVFDDTAGVDHGVYHHVFPNLRAGVTLFFVLSGFLLYRPFAAAVIRREPRPSIRRYSINRALRILPAYWVILLLDALFLDRGLLERPLQLTANFFLAQNYVPAYQPNGHHFLGIGPAWSVVVESSWYVVLPFLALLAGAVARRSRLSPVGAALTPAAVMLAGGCAALAAFRLFPGALGQTWEQFGLPSHASWFATGMFLAVVRVLWEDGRLRVPRWWSPTAVLLAVALTLGATKLSYRGTLLFQDSQSVIAVALALVMSLIVLTERRTRLIRILEWRPIVAVGLASYSVFLWNDPFIRHTRDHGLLLSGAGGLMVNLLFVSVLTGIASWLTYVYVEKRALALKRTQVPKEASPRSESTEPEPMGSLEAGDLAPVEAEAR